MAVLLTDRAQARFDALRLGKHGYPRIEIRAGGCNGFEKVFAWSDAPNEDDMHIKTPNGAVLMDPISYAILERAVVDFVSDLSGSHFSISIPEAVSTCGCGSSFSL